MLFQNYALSSKIRIVSENKRLNFSEEHLNFYTKYSAFILKKLTKSEFQKFMIRILLAENIQTSSIKTVDIELLPSKANKGFSIIGKCDTIRGKIRIYPKSKNFCATFSRKFGKDILIDFVGERARAALIHELLHLKYSGDERKVRELTQSYFSAYMKKRVVKNPVALNSLIFESKSCLKLNKIS
jgi:hypothetical protein